MRSFGTTAAALALAAASTIVSALPAVTRQGKFLYSADGSRFLVKGIAYQEAGTVAASTEANEANGGFPEPDSFVDPLSIESACQRDLPNLQALNVNTIRVYSVNSSLNHDACMKLLSDANIYTIIDLALPLNGSINRADPAWTTDLLGLYTTTIDAFSKYDNVLAFNIGNEVVNLPANTDAAPFVKAAARDTKAYLKSIKSNALVSYTTGDGDAGWLTPLAEFLACGEDSISIDMFGLNDYEACSPGSSSAAATAWASKIASFSDLAVPLYLSEFGCIKAGERTWLEVPALFSAPVSNSWSGGVAFSYFPTADNFGMTTLSSDNKTITVSAEFDTLVTQMANVTLPTTPAKSSVTSESSPACPSATTDFTASTTLPPTPDLSVCQCLEANAFSCVRTEAIASKPVLVGEQIGVGCSLLGSSGATATCDAIAANGANGTYGQVSYCSADIKLSYVYSAYYVAQNHVLTACDFGGNGTVNSQAPTSSSGASDAAKNCFEKKTQDVTTPSSVATGTAAAATGSNPSATSTAAGSSGTAGSNTGGSSARVGGVSLALVGLAVAAFL